MFSSKKVPAHHASGNIILNQIDLNRKYLWCIKRRTLTVSYVKKSILSNKMETRRLLTVMMSNKYSIKVSQNANQ